jgi:FAD/FMN-containing dehydrogenase/heterodisulfide reductase subunit C
MNTREIPYNYTSFTDQDIVCYFLGDEAWKTLEALRSQRSTGQSARMLFEILGDMWVVTRNPYIQDDLQGTPKRWRALQDAMTQRLQLIIGRGNNNELVTQLISKTRAAITHFADQLQAAKILRRKVLRQLSKHTPKVNICFDGLSRVAHATDATDWRVEYPFVVIKPDSEASLPSIIKACIKCGLTVIPRGGGTGYTGAAIPLTPLSAVINTEKLTNVGKVELETLAGTEHAIHTVQVETGVVTRRVTDLAKQHGLVFAVDPTSQDASTIGGNIAMNAGGKKAVLWGTTLDNLASWKMITPQCEWLEVVRVNHNHSKIHEQAQTQFRLTRLAADGVTPAGEPTLLTIPGHTLRKEGLGKDVTDKFLSGLPGVQKEGCDGFITSAKFILHKAPEHILTICLEFFGSNLSQAVPAIVEIKDLVDASDSVLLSGLEHLDERYLKAVKYATKAPRTERPKMLLLADIVSNDLTALQHMAAKMVQCTNKRNGEGFIATSNTARAKFWLDRTRTAAIAAHTNAFKINEDVVIPLKNLATYNDGIEHINIEYSLRNKLAMCQALQIHLTSQPQDEALLAEKRHTALALVNSVQQEWQDTLNHLAENFEELQNRQRIISYKQSLQKPLLNLFAGEELADTRKELLAIHKRVLSSRLFVALHMHAGDGNVHSNIPVNSNDPDMMANADKIVERIMALTKQLDGVISGEHGIGITKIPFLDSETLSAFASYKAKVDPNGHFNKGKLLSNVGMEKAYTPSLRLLQQEALLLEASELGEVNDAIKNCLRCGKCKPVCMTQIPKANMYYSPRDKILGTGALMEAFLYEEQTRRGISLQHFDAFNDIADHCTTCHKCFNPCPVNIDFGDVSIKMRNILHARGKKKFSLSTKLALMFLNINDPTGIKIMRTALIQWGFKGQRFLSKLYNKFQPHKKQATPPPTTGKTPVREQVIYFLKRPMPKAVPSKTARALIGAEDNKTIAIIRDSNKVTADSDAVFYFPGCGSERLFSQIGLATFAMLHHIGVQTVLPPGYLCCGYPQTAAGDKAKGDEISINNRILFHRMANSIGYLQIKTIVVSCGTCIDQLSQYKLEEIFPGARLMDIHEYLMEKEVHIHSDENYIYHDPCHSPMKRYKPEEVASKLMGKPVSGSKFCCGDAGTLSVSRPDIANQLKFRKEKEIADNVAALTQHKENKQVTMLTSCPACLKGLASYTPSTGVKPEYIVVELARKLLGNNWQTEFVEKVQHGGVERILL